MKPDPTNALAEALIIGFCALHEDAEKAYTAERLVKADKAYRRFLRERKAKLNVT
jgi:hypothetical protein